MNQFAPNAGSGSNQAGLRLAKVFFGRLCHPNALHANVRRSSGEDTLSLMTFHLEPICLPQTRHSPPPSYSYLNDLYISLSLIIYIYFLPIQRIGRYRSIAE